MTRATNPPLNPDRLSVRLCIPHTQPQPPRLPEEYEIRIVGGPFAGTKIFDSARDFGNRKTDLTPHIERAGAYGPGTLVICGPLKSPTCCYVIVQRRTLRTRATIREITVAKFVRRPVIPAKTDPSYWWGLETVPHRRPQLPRTGGRGRRQVNGVSRHQRRAGRDSERS